VLALFGAPVAHEDDTERCAVLEHFPCPRQERTFSFALTDRIP
jgi:hypothetical protein